MAIRKIVLRATDELFLNTEISGTEAAKMPVGTTAQRTSAKSGDIRFNSTTSLMEYYDGTIWKSIDSPPSITSISPTTEADANQDIVITGTNFSSGALVTFIGNDGTEYASPSVTVDSPTQITATTPATPLSVANEPYDIKVTNQSGLASTLEDALDAGGSPTWTTASGQVGGEIFEFESVSTSIAATDPDGQSVSYSVTSGAFPTGLSLNSSTGAITGTAPTVSSDTTSAFTATASDGVNTTDRNFNIVVKNDTTRDGLVAWYPTGSGTDSTSNGYNGSFAGDNSGSITTSTDSGTPYGSRTVTNYPDAGAYTSLPTGTVVTGSNDRTITCWVKPAGTLDSNDYIFGFGSDTICNGATFNARCNGRKLSFMGCANDYDNYGDVVYSSGTWVRIFYTYNGSDLIAYYLDGSGNRQTSWTVSKSLNTSIASGGVARIGAHAASTDSGGDLNGCNSAICDFRIYNRVLTQAEMELLYNR